MISKEKAQEWVEILRDSDAYNLPGECQVDIFMYGYVSAFAEMEFDCNEIADILELKYIHEAF